jgi:hypothetical protein
MLNGRVPPVMVLRLCGALILLPLLSQSAWAGSVTADSINDRSAARAAAIEQMPRGATVLRTECQSIQVGGFGLPRWRCTVWFADPPAAAPAGDGRAEPPALPAGGGGGGGPAAPTSIPRS